jgi:predicted RNA-binding protein
MEERRTGQNWFAEECIYFERIRYHLKTRKEKRARMVEITRNGINSTCDSSTKCWIRSKSSKGSSFKKESSDGYFEINEWKGQDSKTIFIRKNVRRKSSKISRIRISKKNCFRQIIECNNAQLMEG